LGLRRKYELSGRSPSRALRAELLLSDDLRARAANVNHHALSVASNVVLSSGLDHHAVGLRLCGLRLLAPVTDKAHSILLPARQAELFLKLHYDVNGDIIRLRVAYLLRESNGLLYDVPGLGVIRYVHASPPAGSKLDK